MQQATPLGSNFRIGSGILIQLPAPRTLLWSLNVRSMVSGSAYRFAAKTLMLELRARSFSKLLSLLERLLTMSLLGVPLFLLRRLDPGSKTLFLQPVLFFGSCYGFPLSYTSEC